MTEEERDSLRQQIEELELKISQEQWDMEDSKRDIENWQEEIADLKKQLNKAL